jgi:hypothetical protein
MVKKKQQMPINYAISYWLSFEVTDPMDQSHALQPNNLSACQEFPGILWNHEHLHSHHVHKPAPESAASSHSTSPKSTVIYRVFLKQAAVYWIRILWTKTKRKIS